MASGAGYGIYPDFKDAYVLHLMFEDAESKRAFERLLMKKFEVSHEEEIPVREGLLEAHPILWRYFLKPSPSMNGRFIATSIHGGVIYVRDGIRADRLGYGASISELMDEDYELLEGLIEDFCRATKYSKGAILSEEFTKIVPVSSRPYGILYQIKAHKYRVP